MTEDHMAGKQKSSTYEAHFIFVLVHVSPCHKNAPRAQLTLLHEGCNLGRMLTRRF